MELPVPGAQPADPPVGEREALAQGPGAGSHRWRGHLARARRANALTLSGRVIWPPRLALLLWSALCEAMTVFCA